MTGKNTEIASPHKKINGCKGYADRREAITKKIVMSTKNNNKSHGKKKCKKRKEAEGNSFILSISSFLFFMIHFQVKNKPNIINFNVNR